jgi:hypothetical protein
MAYLKMAFTRRGDTYPRSNYTFQPQAGTLFPFSPGLRTPLRVGSNASDRPDRRPARKTSHRSTSRCGSHRCRGAGSAAGLSVVLLGASGRLQPRAGCPLGIVRAPDFGRRLRGYDVGDCSQCATRRIKCSLTQPDISRGLPAPDHRVVRCNNKNVCFLLCSGVLPKSVSHYSFTAPVIAAT